MAWQDAFFVAYNTIQQGVVAVASRRILSFGAGFTVADDPVTLRTIVTSAASGGSVLNPTPSTASAVQTLVRAPWQIQIVDMSLGPFTQPFPPSPQYGDRCDLLDPALSPYAGVYENVCLLFGNGVPIQDPQLRSISSYYQFGFVPNSSSQWSGGAYFPLIYTGSFWKAIT